MCCKRNWMDMSDCLYYWEGNSNQIESKFQQRINLKGITHEQFPRRHAHQTHLRQVRASVLGPGQRNQRRISARLSGCGDLNDTQKARAYQAFAEKQALDFSSFLGTLNKPRL